MSDSRLIPLVAHRKSSLKILALKGFFCHTHSLFNCLYNHSAKLFSRNIAVVYNNAHVVEFFSVYVPESHFEDTIC